nr:cytochrome-c peroxidase [Derxia gummosa]
MTLALATLATLSGIALARQNAAPAEPIQPIAPAKVTQPALVELGKKLYFDPRLSRSGAISCNSCHNLATGGTDNLRSSIGDRWQQGPINSPTVLNARFNVAQFWDGRAPDLKAQAGGPIANPGEMASTHELAIGVLRAIPGYAPEFKAAFGDAAIDIDRVTTAIAAFEDTLVTPDSRFDLWLKGDRKALNADELAGYALFKDTGCVSCHNGPAVGGTSFQKLGVAEPFRTDNPAIGRAGVTGKESDRNVFKVPTLRNVELTYPYFHDGSVNSLEEAVRVMGRVQLGRQIGDDDARKIAAFLRTLTGRQPSIVLPALPPSVASTPAPQPF